MIRVSRLADYAVLIVTYMSREQSKTFSAPHIVKVTGIRLATVSKLLFLLTKAGLICATRGSKGGYRLDKPSKDISMKDLIEAIDGPVALTLCMGENEVKCDLFDGCLSRLSWHKVSSSISSSLSEIKLSDMYNSNLLLDKSKQANRVEKSL